MWWRVVCLTVSIDDRVIDSHDVTHVALFVHKDIVDVVDVVAHIHQVLPEHFLMEDLVHLFSRRQKSFIDEEIDEIHRYS